MKPRIVKSSKCGKFLYSSQKIIVGLIENIKEENPERAVGLRHYYCERCNGYHLTSKTDELPLSQGLKYYDEWVKLLNTN